MFFIQNHKCISHLEISSNYFNHIESKIYTYKFVLVENRISIFFTHTLRILFIPVLSHAKLKSEPTYVISKSSNTLKNHIRILSIEYFILKCKACNHNFLRNKSAQKTHTYTFISYKLRCSTHLYMHRNRREVSINSSTRLRCPMYSLYVYTRAW